jgi:DNA polymerase-3 subunit delta
LYGNDEYALSRRLRQLAGMFGDPSESQMNTSRLDAASATDDQFNNAVNALPFLSKQRLVLLANPSKRYTEPDGRRRFLEFISKTPPTTRLVIWEHVEVKTWGTRAGQDKDDERHWLVKGMRRTSMRLERFAQPPAAEMPGWISRHARSEGGELNAGAAAKLAELVGTDTRQAAQEVSKLLTYVNWKRPVTAADVAALSPLTAEPDVFAMVDALAAGHAGQAQRLLHRLLEIQDAFSTWGMMVRQFRLILLAREVLDHGGSETDAAREMSVQPFVARKALNQAKRFTLPRLENIYHRMLEVDEAAKTGRMPLEWGMDVFLLELTA